jgi:hypothetical protein
VTSTILRAAHGQVRCGKCTTQFDAIENLLEGDDDAVTDSDTHEQPAAMYESETVAHEDIVLEGNRIEISGVYRRPAVHLDDDEDTEAHTHTTIEEFTSEPEDWQAPAEGEMDDDLSEAELEDIEHELSAAEIADAMASLDPEVASTAHESHSSVATDDHVVSHSQLLTQASSQPRSSLTLTADSEPAFPPIALDDELFGRRSSPRRWPWLVASIGLLILLLGQSVHHARAALVRHPSIGPQITRLYAAIGQPLAPQWQLQAYSIKQWGIVSDPQEPGTLRVRASVTNGAVFAQPYPLLQLTLEDRFGGKVGTRLFKPGEYLSSQTLATRMLDANEAANVDLAIVDPGQDAVGFQFDTCLKIDPAHLQCTHDLPGVQP